VAWLGTDFSSDARKREPSEQNLRAKAAVPDVSSGLFRSFLVRVRKEKRTMKNRIFPTDNIVCVAWRSKQ